MRLLKLSPKVASAYKLEVRDRIIQTAIQCFSESGYAGTRMQDISEKLGLAKGTIYLYFASKQELFVAICEHCLETLKVQLASIFDSHSIAARAEMYYENFGQIHRGNQKVMLEMTLESARNPRLKRALYRHRLNVNLVISQYLSREVERGNLPTNTDTTALALAFVALYDGLGLGKMQGISDDSSSDAWASMVSAVMRNSRSVQG
jgi:TetR/AcrR family transcriptional repressor of uid operon